MNFDCGLFYFSGVSIHTFHGNFFVRSTDLLSLPNVNPDAGFGMQMSIEENLTESSTVCFQAALLYTSSKGTQSLFLVFCCLIDVVLQHANFVVAVVINKIGLWISSF